MTSRHGPHDRQFGVDLADDVAKAIFDARIPASALHQPTALLAHGKKGAVANLWKKAAQWPDLNIPRAFLEDAVEASRGRTLNQKTWQALLDQWFVGKEHTLRPQDILSAC